MTQANDDHADALAAMAAGQTVGDDAAKAQSAPQPADGQTPPALPDQQPAVPQAFAAAPAPSQAGSIAELKARQARAAAAANRVQHEQLKKTLMPLLLVIGGLLIVAGLVGVFKLATTKGFGVFFKVVVLSSFLVGALLLLGAWWFHRDTSGRKR
jgi:hypothetical protein